MQKFSSQNKIYEKIFKIFVIIHSFIHLFYSGIKSHVIELYQSLNVQKCANKAIEI